MCRAKIVVRILTNSARPDSLCFKTLTTILAWHTQIVTLLLLLLLLLLCWLSTDYEIRRSRVFSITPFFSKVKISDEIHELQEKQLIFFKAEIGCMLRFFRSYIFLNMPWSWNPNRPCPVPLFLFYCRRQLFVWAFWWFVYFISEMLLMWSSGLITSLCLYTSLNKMLKGPHSSVRSTSDLKSRDPGFDPGWGHPELGHGVNMK